VVSLFLGKTRKDLALKMVEEKIFCDTCGARENVTKVVIVITDGKSNMGSVPMQEAIYGLKVSYPPSFHTGTPHFLLRHFGDNIKFKKIIFVILKI